MKRTWIVLLALIAGLAATGFADESGTISLSLWGGYATADMSKFNDAQQQIASLTGGTVDKTDNAGTGAAELLFNVGDRWAIGPRVEYLMLNTGKITTAFAQTKSDQWVLPAMVGGRFFIKKYEDGTSFADHSCVSAGLFGGYATAYNTTKVTTPFGLDTSVDSKGTGFAGNALLGWDYRLSGAVSIGIDAGYRYVKVSEEKASEDNALLGVTRDSVVKDLNGNTIEYDFSGLIAEVGITIRL
jgi:hypothetical protein